MAFECSQCPETLRPTGHMTVESGCNYSHSKDRAPGHPLGSFSRAATQVPQTEGLKTTKVYSLSVLKGVHESEISA